MQTSEQWWVEVKANNKKFVRWLKKQYRGELAAAVRIEQFCTKVAPPKWKPTLRKIAAQERTHAQWIGQLLTTRGISLEIIEIPERYWDETLSSITDFVSATAVAAHAEIMRLERINVIASDLSVDADILGTFVKIRAEEVFHAKAFSAMAGKKALTKAGEAHRRGKRAIGLITASEMV